MCCAEQYNTDNLKNVSIKGSILCHIKRHSGLLRKVAEDMVN